MRLASVTKHRPHIGAGVPQMRKSASQSAGPSSFGSVRDFGKRGHVAYGSYVDKLLAILPPTGLAADWKFVHSNHLYSVAALTDNSGNVVERYRYDAYGNRTVLAADGVTTRTASLYGNQVGFTGRYLDKETGLWYFRARYYSGSLGRFIGRDPLAWTIYNIESWHYYLTTSLRHGFEWDDVSMGLSTRVRHPYVQDVSRLDPTGFNPAVVLGAVGAALDGESIIDKIVGGAPPEEVLGVGAEKKYKDKREYSDVREVVKRSALLASEYDDWQHSDAGSTNNKYRAEEVEFVFRMAAADDDWATWERVTPDYYSRERRSLSSINFSQPLPMSWEAGFTVKGIDRGGNRGVSWTWNDGTGSEVTDRDCTVEMYVAWEAYVVVSGLGGRSHFYPKGFGTTNSDARWGELPISRSGSGLEYDKTKATIGGEWVLGGFKSYKIK